MISPADRIVNQYFLSPDAITIETSNQSQHSYFNGLQSTNAQ